MKEKEQLRKKNSKKPNPRKSITKKVSHEQQDDESPTKISRVFKVVNNAYLSQKHATTLLYQAGYTSFQVGEILKKTDEFS